MNLKNWGKFWDFSFNIFLCKYLFWINISYFSIHQPKKGINSGKKEKRKKISNFFFQFFLWSKWPYYEDFMVKISIDIKMCNLWPYKNYYYKSKYPIVLLQESCEILQFKSGHPVFQKNVGNLLLCI